MSGLGRFVVTTQIKDAVKGHETKILDALGIDWRAGRPHNVCPYPDHPDNNPSWRWDEQKTRAFCSCGSADIFEVVTKVEGLDFEEAKLRVAELLGRADLVREKGNGTEARQAMDAASLLNAPVANRDDELPIAYLAYRLGVPPATVPVPSTPIAGLKALGYFDAPAPGSRAKPKLLLALSSAPSPPTGARMRTVSIWPPRDRERRISAIARMESRVIRRSQQRSSAASTPSAARSCGETRIGSLT